MIEPLLESLSAGTGAILTTFSVIFLAELGDKSQLVCMTLAARYRHWPVLIGAVLAFMLLNGLAVVFGVGLVRWLPENLLAGIAAVLFAVFGVMGLMAKPEDEAAPAPRWTERGVAVATFGMIVVAEMGDKTQLAVAGLAVTLPPWPVWAGATAALAATSALGIWVGARLLHLMPLHRLHQAGGVLFLVLAAIALTRAF